MSKLEVGNTYKSGFGHDVDIVFYDDERDLFIGWNHTANRHNAYEPCGSMRASQSDMQNLIIPPSLAWEWIVGDWYLRRNRDACWLQAHCGGVCIFNIGCHALQNCGKVYSNYEDQSDIIAHLGPMPQGVYHVSDGDTQLLAHLKRWQDRGGRIQAKADGGAWVFHQSEHPLATIAEYLVYRAHGCTDDREFPQPTKPLQMRAGPCRTRSGEVVELKPYGNKSYPWHCIGSDGSFRSYKNNGRWLPHDESSWDIVELLDPQPEPKQDPMQRPMTFADYAKICKLRGFEDGDKIYRDIREAAESQP